uniref:Helicase C-terminal domain-containing protein n=1 Tax=Bursaphelenchus xylophilus TaxID=6326 RepID=A0A1I7S6Q5_BURXY
MDHLHPMLRRVRTFHLVRAHANKTQEGAAFQEAGNAEKADDYASPQFASILRPTRPPAKLNMERFKERLKLTGYAKFLVETPYPKEIKQHITPIKQQTPVLNQDLIDFLSIFKENTDQDGPIKNVLRALRISKEEWIQAAASKFNMYVMEVLCRPLHPDDRFYGKLRTYFERFQVNSSYNSITDLYSKRTKLDDDMLINRLMRFPEARLIEYDCGKLQTLARLLRNLYEDGHRCLIFTQMSKMLDILQAFLAHHGYVYFRLDGATPVEKRQALMERFNSDPKVFCFILSTRAGGVGINLIGADTVIFYDSDWNPTMDAQAQDRCHRVGFFGGLRGNFCRVFELNVTGNGYFYGVCVDF